MSNPSLKKTIISNLAMSKHTSELKDNSLILITASGIIVGDLLDIDDADNSNPANFIGNLINHISTNYKEEFSLENQDFLSNNDGYLTLKNAKILTNGKVDANFNILTVFFDQIIGITIGNIDI